MYFGSGQNLTHPLSYNALSPEIVDAMLKLRVPKNWSQLVGGGLSSPAGVLEVYGRQRGIKFAPEVLFLFGTRQILATPEDWTPEGLRRKYDREQLKRIVRVAFPSCLAIALADSQLAIEEIRLLRNLIQLTPREDRKNSWFQDLLLNLGTGVMDVFQSEAEKSSKLEREEVVRFLTMMACADGKPNELERGLLLKYGETMGLGIAEVKSQVAACEKDLHKQSVLGEAMVRAQHAVFGSMGLSDRAIALLNTTLTTGILDEITRRRIAESLAVDSSFTKRVELAEAFVSEDEGLLKKLQDFFNENDLKNAERKILRATAFSLVIEGGLPTAREVGESKVRELALTYGFGKEEQEKESEWTRETLKECKAQLSDLIHAQCPTC